MEEQEWWGGHEGVEWRHAGIARALRQRGKHRVRVDHEVEGVKTEGVEDMGEGGRANWHGGRNVKTVFPVHPFTFRGVFATSPSDESR